MKLKYVFLCGLLICSSATAHSGMLPFDWDLQVTQSYLQVPIQSGQVRPLLFQSGLGASAAWEFDLLPIMIGVDSDFRIIKQYSAVNAAVGNWSGWRYNFVAPMIGVRALGITIKADAQLIGDYTLKNKSPSGQQIRYVKPVGARVQILKRIMPIMQFGLQAEYLTFAGQETTYVKSVTFETPLKFLSAGLVLAFSL